jgi:Ca2+-binding RTX toxin-like protein
LERGVAIQGEPADPACRSEPEEASMRGRIIVVAVVLGAALGASTGRVAAQGDEDCALLPPTIVPQGGTVYGTGGRDVIAAQNNGVVDLIYGFGGDDVICAGPGDTVYAGSGSDFVLAVGAVAIYGESGNDSITAIGTPLVSGGTGNDTLTDGGDSPLFGDAGNDTLVDGAFCDGGSGHDTAIRCITKKSIETTAE